MAKLLLLRHGHVAGISPERFRGRADLRLTAEGHRQAAATARRIAASWRPAAVYCSPLSRCRATAAEIARPFSLEPTPMEALTDIDYGEWQGLTVDEVRARWADQLDLWRQRPEWAMLPGGETLQKVLMRVTDALRIGTGRHPAGTVVMVGHDSVNRVILLHALGLPLAGYWRIAQHPCAINELDFDRGVFTINAINTTDHLREIAPG